MLKAAQSCHCSPWELLEQPYEWQARALAALEAENWAIEERRKRDRPNT